MMCKSEHVVCLARVINIDALIAEHGKPLQQERRQYDISPFMVRLVV